MSFLRSIIVFGAALAVLSGCEGTQTGRTLFGTPSDTNIASIKIVLVGTPNRSIPAAQSYPLQVNAYDRYGNLINATYNENITVSSNGGGCEIYFQFYTPNSTSSPPPPAVSLDFNTPQEVAVDFLPDPSDGCTNQPNPVTITASASGVPNASISF
jgi:hypothetical protein